MLEKRVIEREQVKCEKVLLVDDHQNMLVGARGLLADKFKMVFMVADEPSLLEVVDKLQPDLIIVDLSFKIAGEINVTGFLRKLFPEIPYIILSVHDEQSAIDECLEAGAKGFVLKRKAVDDLIPAIDAVLAGSCYISSSPNQKDTTR